MKKKYVTNSFLVVMIALLFSSCAYKIYPTSDLYSRYDSKMTSKQELATKSRIHIFLSENDVPCDYELLSFVTYSPFSIPIFAPQRKQMLNKFYKKAVLKAEELGGNAIIVSAVGFFKVIYAKDLNKVEASDKGMTPTKSSSIIVDAFENGTVQNLEKKEQNAYVEKLKDEIEKGIKECKTLEEAEVVANKISVLEQFYKNEGDNKRIQKLLNGYRGDLRDAENEILKLEIEKGIDESKTHEELQGIAKKIELLEERFKEDGGKKKNLNLIEDYRDDLSKADKNIAKQEAKAAKKARNAAAKEAKKAN